MNDTYGWADPAGRTRRRWALGVPGRRVPDAVERGTSPAVDVAKNCSIPVPRIYDILNELEQMGYVETLDRDKLHARACDPVEFIEDLHHKSARLSDVASEIEDRWEQSPLGEHEINVTKHAQTVPDHAGGQNSRRGVGRRPRRDRPAARRPEGHWRRPWRTTSSSARRCTLGVGESSILDDHPVTDVVTEIRARSIRGPFLAVMDRTVACLAPTERMPDSTASSSTTNSSPSSSSGTSRPASGRCGRPTTSADGIPCGTSRSRSSSVTSTRSGGRTRPSP